MKDRKKQRENRRMKAMEEKIDLLNAYGYRDPTAYLAVRNIVVKQKKAPVRR